ncbi:Ribosomal oxygenase 1 (Bifunctional lysine-specific demethylase and histidyl-hydroxylase NO66) (Histone lysine demethylase NO66) [Durusdinium trenchii]|uniref:Ribosomal oxygenase 1 (Bifunctional lysine-specific demethylase and histidyl-hydroxylase NO66) (Histone lysine demethylase NO66) n=1 Tax=Durusdinium trenchii TaxID=1381693 RepID=A0ABP0HHD0_9DINO
MAGLEDRSPAEAFAWLLAPLTEQQFFERHWEKCPLHLRGADAGRFRGLLSQRVIESRLASKPGLIYGKDINLARCGANGEQIMCNGTGRAGAEAVQKKVREGCSVQVVHPQRFGSEVACLLSKLESHFGCLWGANSFRTPPGGKGFKAHHDEVEVFMLQLEGAKRWRLHRCPEGPLPRSYCWDYEGKDLGEPLMELVLQPGDLLYLPRGTIHQGEAVEGHPSHHLTISTYQRHSWADFLEKALPEALARASQQPGDSLFREGLPLRCWSYLGEQYKTKIPTPPTGSVWIFQGIQTLIGLAIAVLLEFFNAEDFFQRCLRFEGANGMGLALAICALVSQFVMLPAMNDLVKAREEQKVGQPIHHPAPNELDGGCDRSPRKEDDRILFLYKLRAFENIVEWLPVFIIHAVALVALGQTGICVVLCIPYTAGKVMFSYGYGSGNSDSRVPGLIVSDFFGLLVMRGICIIALVLGCLSGLGVKTAAVGGWGGGGPWYRLLLPALSLQRSIQVMSPAETSHLSRLEGEEGAHQLVALAFLRGRPPSRRIQLWRSLEVRRMGRKPSCFWGGRHWGRGSVPQHRATRAGACPFFRCLRSMQGGAREDLVHLKQVGKACDACRKDGRKAREEPQTPPLDTLKVEKELFLSPQADALLMKARELFATSVALPIAWLHLDPDVESSRRRKHERVKEGAEFVCQLQQQCRSKLLDRYFLFWSFFAEEEFYLLSLPLLFWCGDYRFARHMTYVVCFGLVWGNLLKDVFRLPRPRNVKQEVWVPHSASQIDSTACRDFGFPSTHAMNSVSNSLFAVLFYLENPRISSTVMVLCMCFWISSISFARLYLGVHSPMDVKGGLILGFAIALLAKPAELCFAFDRFMLRTPHVGLLLVLLVVLVLVLNPQPRPMTPTFMQNCTLCGLILGCAVGFRMETDRRAASGAASLEEPAMPLPALLRVLVGYSMLMIARMVLKQLLSKLLGLLGLEPNPKPKNLNGEKPAIKGWDLFAAAFVKVSVYAAMAWTIVCGAPAVFEVMRIPCAMNG